MHSKLQLENFKTNTKTKYKKIIKEKLQKKNALVTIIHLLKKITKEN